MHLDPHNGPLLSRDVGILADHHRLVPDGEYFSVGVFSWKTDDPAYSPVKTEGTLSIPVASVRQEIRNQRPGLAFDDRAPLFVSRDSVVYNNPPLPGDRFTSADLPYDETTGEFAHVTKGFCSWGGSLLGYPGVRVRGTLDFRHSVNPSHYPWLEEQAKTGRPVVLSPKDYVSQYLTTLA